MATASTAQNRRQGNRRGKGQSKAKGKEQQFTPPDQPPEDPQEKEPMKTPKGQIKLDNNPVGNHQIYRQLLDDWQKDLTAMLAKGICPTQFMRTALNTWVTTPKLKESARISVVNALAIAAQLGLHPNGVGGEGWIGCYPSRHMPEGVLEATFLTGYQGAIKLMMNHPDVVGIDAKAVCANEASGDNGHFDWQGGTDSYIDHHVPLTGERGEPVGGYAIAWLRNAPKPIFVVMTKAEIDQRRDTSRDNESRLWSDYKTIGYMKTAVFQLAKIVPKSSGMALAIEIENRYEQGKATVDLGPLADGAHSTTGTSRTDQLADQLGVNNPPQ